MPTWAFDFTGRVREIHNRHIKIEKQLSEHLDDQSGQRHVLALARYLDTDEEIMLKIRYDLNPEQFDIEDLKESREDADMMFLHEADGVENVYAIHHGPRYITHVTQPAGQEMPYPDGWADFPITSRVPGDDDVAEISGELTHLRQNGKVFYTQDQGALRYDVQNDKLYFVDFTHMSLIDPNYGNWTSITPDTTFVTGFNLWSHSHLRRAKEIAKIK
ncbi:hypothetical protein MW887_004189 [Aspergillus wentii]|nr:hypothetical protein MW887_004189 [Aspergillus wentii]